MATHELKTHPEPFAAACDGRKRHEIRRDDRGFAVGDLLHLREWVPPEPRVAHAALPPAGFYTGHAEVFRVTYLTRGPEWGVPEGMVVMSIEPSGAVARERLAAAVRAWAEYDAARDDSRHMSRLPEEHAAADARVAAAHDALAALLRA